MNLESTTDFYSDPTFTVFKVPRWRAFFYRFLSLNLWGNLPSPLQRKISQAYAQFYESAASKSLIEPYIRLNYSSKDYLNTFKPPFEKGTYDTFQDFFIRRFKNLPRNTSSTVWPCEGLLCEEGKLKNVKQANVKGDVRSVETVFGLSKGAISPEYHFVNVFLHNKNYHRIHAPVTGRITRIQHMPGDLVVLRPWIYKQNPSLPAFRNERYNVDIQDEVGRIWHLSIVGGPAVGTIRLPDYVKLNATIEKLEELAVFYLGSTCCMASPVSPRFHSTNSFVEVGNSY